MNSYIILNDGIMLSIGMQPYNVDKSHPNYSKVLDAVKAGEWNLIPDLVNVSRALVKYCGDSAISIDVDAAVVLFNGEELHGTIAERLLRMMREGFSVDPLVAFLTNLMQNPSKRSVDELYGFLEYGKMPITEDGHFLAYKRVRSDYMSVHDGKTDNSIGKIVEMPRNKVDDNKDSTCSYGLHFCSHEYLSNFSGDRVVVLKVNPRDVVSIPSDYNNTKGRACRYEVVGELSKEEVDKAMSNGVWEDSVVNDYDDRDSDEWDKVEAMTEEVSENYLNGYSEGYADGRIKADAGLSGTDDYSAGYRRGLKDGKGHRARALLIVNEVLEAPTDRDVYSS